jgi:hypothetical protein
LATGADADAPTDAEAHLPASRSTDEYSTDDHTYCEPPTLKKMKLEELSPQKEAPDETSGCILISSDTEPDEPPPPPSNISTPR